MRKSTLLGIVYVPHSLPTMDLVLLLTENYHQETSSPFRVFEFHTVEEKLTVIDFLEKTSHVELSNHCTP